MRPLLPLDVFKTFERFETLQHAVAAQEQFGPADLQAALHGARMGKTTMQTMVFDPVNLRLWVALGVCPSSGAVMQLLELGPLFSTP